jgi:hypothetical protein
MKAMVKGMMLGTRKVAATLSLKGREEGSSIKQQSLASYKTRPRCVPTAVGDVSGCEGTDDGEWLAVEAAVGKDCEPLLSS